MSLVLWGLTCWIKDSIKYHEVKEPYVVEKVLEKIEIEPINVVIANGKE